MFFYGRKVFLLDLSYDFQCVFPLLYNKNKAREIIKSLLSPHAFPILKCDNHILIFSLAVIAKYENTFCCLF